MLYLGWILITIGVVFIFFGIIALFRFPDFYTKLHAAGVIESCGVPFCLVGLAIMQSDYSSSFKLFFIAALIFILNPVTTHSLGYASLLYKVGKNGKGK